MEGNESIYRDDDALDLDETLLDEERSVGASARLNRPADNARMATPGEALSEDWDSGLGSEDFLGLADQLGNGMAEGPEEFTLGDDDGSTGWLLESVEEGGAEAYVPNPAESARGDDYDAQMPSMPDGGPAIGLDDESVSAPEPEPWEAGDASEDWSGAEGDEYELEEAAPVRRHWLTGRNAVLGFALGTVAVVGLSLLREGGGFFTGGDAGPQPVSKPRPVANARPAPTNAADPAADVADDAETVELAGPTTADAETDVELVTPPVDPLPSDRARDLVARASRSGASGAPGAPASLGDLRLALGHTLSTALPVLPSPEGPPPVGAAHPALPGGPGVLSVEGITSPSIGTPTGEPSQEGIVAMVTEGTTLIWPGVTVPMDAIEAPGRLLTPAVGSVRVFVENGEVYNGRLYGVGQQRVWLDTELGRLGLDGHLVTRIDRLPPSAAGGGIEDTVVGDRVRVTMRGGVIYGHVIARDGTRVTLRTDGGGRVTLDDPIIETVGEGTQVILKQTEL